MELLDPKKSPECLFLVLCSIPFAKLSALLSSELASLHLPADQVSAMQGWEE